MIEKTIDKVNQVTGFYRGIVKKHLTNGRCKIFIPAIYPNSFEDVPESLPDAQQAAPLFAVSKNGSKNGLYSYPEIGSIVWCFFENNDVNFPVYFAATHEFGETEQQWDSIGPETGNIKKLVVDGVEIIVNSEDKSVSITNGANAKIEMSSDGKITISGKEVAIESNTGLTIKGSTIDINGTIVRTTAIGSAYTSASRVGIYATGGAVHIQADDPSEAIFVN